MKKCQISDLKNAFSSKKSSNFVNFFQKISRSRSDVSTVPASHQLRDGSFEPFSSKTRFSGRLLFQFFRIFLEGVPGRSDIGPAATRARIQKEKRRKKKKKISKSKNLQNFEN